MPPLPPLLPPPTNDIESLGPDKVDLDRSPDDIHYIKASEWNNFKKYLKNLYEVVTASLPGTAVTLWDAYINHGAGTNLAPARIFVDATIKGVVVSDASTPIGTVLLGVSARNGSQEYGFYAQGLRLRDNADAIHTSGAAVQMRSGQAPSTSAAYFLDTLNAYTNSQAMFVLRNAGVSAYSFFGNGTFIAHDHANPSTKLWGLVPEYGSGPFPIQGVRLVSDLAGAGTLLPTANNIGTLGSKNDLWVGVHAFYHATNKMVVPFNTPTVFINAYNGEIQELTLTGDTTVQIIGAAEIGTTITLVFIQGGTLGNHLLGIHSSIKTNGPFRVSQVLGDTDTLTVRYNGSFWAEVGRHQERSLERGIGSALMGGGSGIQLVVSRSARTTEFRGTLSSGPEEITVDPTGAVNGDRFELIFEEASGVVTTTVHTLTIKIAGGATLATFNQNKTLRGRALLYYTTAWKYSAGAALSYA